MTTSADVSVPIKHTDRFFIGGEWVPPSSDSTITVIDSHTEQAYLTVAEAQAADSDLGRHRRAGSLRPRTMGPAVARRAGRLPAGNRRRDQ